MSAVFQIETIIFREVIGFLGGLAALLAYRMLTGRMNLRRILCDPNSVSDAVSPERVQLLIATLVVSGRYIVWMAHGTGTTLPNVDGNLLAGMGASGGLYGMVKGLRSWATGRSRFAK